MYYAQLNIYSTPYAFSLCSLFFPTRLIDCELSKGGHFIIVQPAPSTVPDTYKKLTLPKKSAFWYCGMRKIVIGRYPTCWLFQGLRRLPAHLLQCSKWSICLTWKIFCRKTPWNRPQTALTLDKGSKKKKKNGEAGQSQMINKSVSHAFPINDFANLQLLKICITDLLWVQTRRVFPNV